MQTELNVENILHSFAGTIPEEDVHEWFDLRGMKRQQ